VRSTGRGTPPKPRSSALVSLKNYPLEKLVAFIDWAPFFQAWDLAGKYPDILRTAWSAKPRATC
jgi:cobalamin-dependent methionine synthase I